MNNRVHQVYVCNNMLTSTVRQRISSSPGYSNHFNQKHYANADRRDPLIDIKPNLRKADTKYAGNSNVNYLCVGVPKQRSCSTSRVKYSSSNYEGHIDNGYYMEAGPSVAKSKHNVDLNYVTVKNVPSSERYDTDVEDDVFIVAGKTNNSKKLSPIERNERTSQDTVIRSPAVKWLNRKKSQLAKNQTSGKMDISYVFGRLHNKEYIVDNITYLFKNENLHLIQSGKFKENNVNVNARAVVIDWLIKMQEQFSMSRITFLQTVRLFDNILTNTDVAINMYQLVAVTCYWILSKYNDPVAATAKTILRLTGGAYEIDQLLNMELKIFSYMNCKCNIVDPSAFLEYYIIWAGIEDKNILLASYYMLELITLSPYFSMTSPSLLAISSLYLALRTLSVDIKILRKLENCKIYYRFEETSLIQQRIWQILERVVTKKLPLQSCYIKHSTIDYNFISLYITKALATK